jgi:hypothetical protein
VWGAKILITQAELADLQAKRNFRHPQAIDHELPGLVVGEIGSPAILVLRQPDRLAGGDWMAAFLFKLETAEGEPAAV